MNIRKIILLSLLFLTALAACKDDDDQGENNYWGESKIRVKSIVGENAIWGKYELQFNYFPDGRLENAWRFDQADRRDTLGRFVVNYDTDYHLFQILDYVVNIDADSVKVLQDLYPETYKDTLKHRRAIRTLYLVEMENNNWDRWNYRPRRNTGSGTQFNSSYVNVSSQLQRLEKSPEGKPLVIRCNEDVFGDGGENYNYERSIIKYEFTYDGGEMVSGIVAKPDSYSETSWSKLYDISFSSYSGVLTGVDSDRYKMRRSAKKVVIAEPGKNITYTLNDDGLAIKMETSDGETATITYENGSGNFAELYATPLDRVFGKVWVK